MIGSYYKGFKHRRKNNYSKATMDSDASGSGVTFEREASQLSEDSPAEMGVEEAAFVDHTERTRKKAKEEHSEMQDRVRKIVDGIYGDKVKKVRRRQPGELRRSDILEKMLPPALTAKEQEARRKVREKADEYMRQGNELWTDQLKFLRDYYLRLLSGEVAREEEEMFFDNKAFIGSTGMVGIIPDMKTDGAFKAQ